jgi:hypothetical protein
MLRKYSVPMMVLLVAASLIGISSIHQYIEGSQTQRTLQLQGRVVGAIISADKTCTAFVELPVDRPNILKLPPGTSLSLTAPIESCTFFGLAKTSKTPIQFVVPAPTAASSTEREYRVTQVIL